MKLFIDCEFNGFGGDLISMALVDENGEHFYEVLPCPNPVPWVAENVIPYLMQEPLPDAFLMSSKLFSFLGKYDTIHVIADWPEDISYFCRALIIGPGQRINTPHITMEIVRIDPKNTIPSLIPHNALADAQALKNSYYFLMRYF